MVIMTLAIAIKTENIVLTEILIMVVSLIMTIMIAAILISMITILR